MGETTGINESGILFNTTKIAGQPQVVPAVLGFVWHLCYADGFHRRRVFNPYWPMARSCSGFFGFCFGSAHNFAAHLCFLQKTTAVSKVKVRSN